MSYAVDNAVIMAAGMSSRFAPISYESPKALITVKGEVLIERQIKQLLEAGIKDIYIVVGYLKEQFGYLKEKYAVELIENAEYVQRNNNGSIYAAKEYISNTYICSADNYFVINPFENTVDHSYYAVKYAHGDTTEWCVNTDSSDKIKGITIGGRNSFYLFGHAFWNVDFSKKFLSILKKMYVKEETKSMFWEDIYMRNMDSLEMYVRKYGENEILEFDSIDELRMFDEQYRECSGSRILERIARKLNRREGELSQFVPIKSRDGIVIGVDFLCGDCRYSYTYKDDLVKVCV